MQGNDIEENPGPTFSKLNMTCLVGNFHQGDHKEFHAKSVGKQCVANSIIAIIYSTILPLKSWEAKNLDVILRSGDRLYSRINSQHGYLLISDIPDVSQHGYLLISDIPDVITEFGKQYSIDKQGEMFGMLTKGQFNGIGQELDIAVKSVIHDNKMTHAVMCIGQPPTTSVSSRLKGGSACALLLMKGNYYIFDPHSRDKCGKPIDSRAAVLLNFKTVKHLCTYIRNLGI